LQPRPEDAELAALSDECVAPGPGGAGLGFEPSMEALLSSGAGPIEAHQHATPRPAGADQDKPNTFRERNDINGTLLRPADVGTGYAT